MKYVLMTQILTHADAVAAETYEMPIVLKEAEPEPVVQAEVEPEWRTFEVTAYTANAESTGKLPSDAGYGITASGEPVRANYTAACPKSLPFGTRLEIEGLGERVCTDRGGAIGEGRLDVYMAELNDALEFGRQSRQVRIIE